MTDPGAPGQLCPSSRAALGDLPNGDGSGVRARALIIHCPDAEEDGGQVECDPADTYADVRLKILEQLDDEMLPEGFTEENVDDFDLLFASGKRVSVFQLKNKRPFEMGIEELTLRRKKQKSALPAPMAASAISAAPPLLLTPPSTVTPAGRPRDVRSTPQTIRVSPP